MRKINKANVQDRVVHHALFRKLYFIFDRAFIFDSYSCRIKKGTHRADQDILINLIKRRVKEEDVIWLIEVILKSFKSGLPLGNITSQLFANIYLNELDQFIKHTLRVKYYIRYCDDFVILNVDKKYLENLIPKIAEFLENNLKLSLHPNKIFIRKLKLGMDFLGWVNFFGYRILRNKTNLLNNK